MHSLSHIHTHTVKQGREHRERPAWPLPCLFRNTVSGAACLRDSSGKVCVWLRAFQLTYVHINLLCCCLERSCLLLLRSLWSNGIQGNQLTSHWQRLDTTLRARIYDCVSLTGCFHVRLHVLMCCYMFGVCAGLSVCAPAKRGMSTSFCCVFWLCHVTE